MVLLSAGGLLTLGVSPASAGSSNGEDQQTVDVVGSGSAVSLDHSTVWSGSISFHVSTTNPSTADGGGSSVSLWQPQGGADVDQVMKDLQDEFSQDPATAALGTRELTRDARILGLAEVVVGSPEVATQSLTPGTYYLMDLGVAPVSGPPALTTLTVRKGSGDDSDVHSDFTVQATSADRFVAPASWPHEGTYTFDNVSDTLHFMVIVPVKAGTTDQDITDFFNNPQAGPPPFAMSGPSGGNDVLSPGETLQLSYDLPRGTYVLLCFIADDVTGMPHAVMGMHKVVVLH
jgi:hypothetical protein